EELLRGERSGDAEFVAVDLVGRRAERDLGRAADAVPPEALEEQSAFTGVALRGERLLREIAVGAHREHVAEGGLELELDRDRHRMGVRVQYPDPLAH